MEFGEATRHVSLVDDYFIECGIVEDAVAQGVTAIVCLGGLDVWFGLWPLCLFASFARHSGSGEG